MLLNDFYLNDTDEVYVNFYTESGKFIANQPNKIIVKAFKKIGVPLNIKGIITN
jgi:hypothetical protein